LRASGNEDATGDRVTTDYIAYHAAERPEAVAIVSDSQLVTYAELHRDIRKFAAALRGLGLTPGASAAIGCEDSYVKCLLLLACERLGVAAASLGTREGPSVLPLLAGVALVLSDHEFPVGAAPRYHAITPEWVRSVLARLGVDDLPSPPKGPDDVIRIGRTSGTTGGSKRLGFSRRQRDARVSAQAWGAELTHRARCLIALPLTVNSSYVLALAALRWGATLVFESTMEIPRTISARAVTHVMLLPIHLRILLDQLPPDFEKPSELTILSIGAPLSDSLRDRAMARLASRVCDIYGTQEIGNIASRTSGGTGGIATVWPDVEVEVVDDADVPVPMGTPGRLRVRAGYMVQGYLDDADATRRMFRHGWFYPGDAAILHGPRRLQLVGRADDLLNIGGTKIAPGVLEELVLRRVDAGDAGVCALRNAEGIEEIWIAVTDCPLLDAELLSRLDQALGRMQIGTFRILRLPQLPRNASGKIQRDQLRALMIEAARPASA